jgi:Na+-driven multidrug efflux pump
VSIVFLAAPRFGVAAVYIGFVLSLAISTAISIIIYRKELWCKKLNENVLDPAQYATA